MFTLSVPSCYNDDNRSGNVSYDFIFQEERELVRLGIDYFSNHIDF